MDKKTAGILFVLGACIMWAIEPIVAKLSYVDTDIMQSFTIRTITAVFFALVYILLSKSASFRVTKKQGYALVYIALTSGIVADFLYYYSFLTIPVVNAALIAHLQPVFIIFLGYFLLRDEKPSLFDYFGVFFMFLSGLLVSTKTLANLYSFKLGTFSDFLVLASAFIWATGVVVMRKYLKDIHAGTIVFYRFLTAAIVYSLYLIYRELFYLSNIYQLLSGITVGIGIILYYEGLKRLKGVQASSVELASPFFAAILGFLILGETTTLLQNIGIITLFFGVYFISKREDKI